MRRLSATSRSNSSVARRARRRISRSSSRFAPSITAGWSIGYDAAAWERELRQRRRVRAFRIALGSALVAIVCMGLFALHFAREARHEARQARINLYKVQLNGAEAAWHNGEVDRMRTLLLSVLPRSGEDDLRGFEWSYLWRLAQPRELPDPILPSDIRCVSVTPDGDTLALGCADGHIELWNPRTKQAVDRYPASTESIACIAISPDGKRVAIGGPGTTVSLYDVARKTLQPPFRGHFDRVATLCFSDDGKWLASGDRYGEVRVWNPVTGSLHTRNHDRNRKGWILALAFSHDNQDSA